VSVADQWCGSNEFFSAPLFFSLSFGKIQKFSFVYFFIQSDSHFFNYYFFIFYILISFFNFVYHHLISFSFYIEFGPYYFNFNLFIFYNFL